MVESLQHKLDRVRPPRVQITYDVEIGNAIVMKALPFVMGVIADLSGVPADPLPKLKERKFVEIDRDNFDDIMGKVKTRLPLRVENKLTNDNSHMSAELFFHTIDDFNPLNVVKQIGPLKKLYEARTHLKDLLTKLDGNDVLDELLQEIIQSTDQRDALKAELGIADEAAAAPAAGSTASEETPAS
ncbi:type VI secretion system contractile sheath small subunit [Candidatus Paracaedibacter symbiosus]|uniref:type VI secretion system contractile sheath small subunit n=1 Tax=Candidatus Paracaedibacter symbiosus TaxID=244582 RepID=UPI0005095B1C